MQPKKRHFFTFLKIHSTGSELNLLHRITRLGLGLGPTTSLGFFLSERSLEIETKASNKSSKYEISWPKKASQGLNIEIEHVPKQMESRKKIEETNCCSWKPF